jgi:hypothetical protein
MLENFRGYFGEIEMPGPIVERAEQICTAFDQAIELPLEDVFVCDVFEAEGARRFTSLWLRTPSYFIEAKNFVVAQQIDFTTASGTDYVEFTRSDLVNLDQTGPGTTLHVTVQFSVGMHGVLTAAHNNCRYLYVFATKHFMPKRTKAT